MISVFDNLIFKQNIKNEVHHLKDELINDTLKSKENYNRKNVNGGQNLNFEVSTKHKEYLYNIFLEKSKKYLNKFTLKDTDFRLWCYYTNNDYIGTMKWHNHLNTSTINGVLYIETVKDKGIKFKHDKEFYYFEPEDYDLLIFPDFLNHLPKRSKDKRRMSFNMELRCIESSKEIFKI